MYGFENDYIMRQIKGLAAMVAKLMFNREVKPYAVTEQARGEDAKSSLAERLRGMVADGKIDEAENLLFQAAETRDHEVLYAALDFYGTLENLTDEDLKESGFTHGEVEQGLTDLFALYGMDIGWMNKK